jgi:rare lipoprotein A
MKQTVLLTLLTLFIFQGITFAQNKSAENTTKSTRNKKTDTVEYGIASFYHDKFDGRPTANGEIFSQKKLTAAHNRLPMGTWVQVTNLKNKKTVIVRINDRMHRNNPRLVDLSSAAAAELGIGPDNLLKVKVEVLDKKKRRIRSGTT